MQTRPHRLCSPVVQRRRLLSLCASAVRSFFLAEHCARSRSGWLGVSPPSRHPAHHAPLSWQRLQSGTTGVCALIAGKTLHIAWLGDSQVILVQQGQVVKLMEPHRPERQVRAPPSGPETSPAPITPHCAGRQMVIEVRGPWTTFKENSWCSPRRRALVDLSDWSLGVVPESSQPRVPSKPFSPQ